MSRVAAPLTPRILPASSRCSRAKVVGLTGVPHQETGASASVNGRSARGPYMELGSTLGNPGSPYGSTRRQGRVAEGAWLRVSQRRGGRCDSGSVAGVTPHIWRKSPRPRKTLARLFKNLDRMAAMMNPRWSQPYPPTVDQVSHPSYRETYSNPCHGAASVSKPGSVNPWAPSETLMRRNIKRSFNGSS